ncbi:MAG: hypothetical protein ABI120_19065, partial [Gemmatimonadaceae bacterium]
MTTPGDAVNVSVTGNSSVTHEDVTEHRGAREATPEAHALKWAADVDSKVCWVEPDGEVVCAHAEASRSLAVDIPPALLDALTTLFGASGWGPNKIKLGASLLYELSKSTIDDDWIPFRAFEAALSVNRLLKENAPPLLLYNYSDLPMYVMGAFLLS